jgi:endogenous inhibitor of DNA gyrase (YacG/DUF329 family)
MSDRSALPGAKPCPICRKPAVEQFRPFCSKRCADVDLNRWLSDVYVVPGRDDEEEDERPARPADGE